ncbi:MAG: glycosyltransferase family 1 protein [Acidobacteria bacterium]|nr:glycosyltransferase family 1 protein [Acidobacteriota bacterium]
MTRAGSKGPFRIGIDAHAIGARQGGNETYIRNLILALTRIDQENRYTVYLASREAAAEWRERFAADAPNFGVRLLPPPTPIVRAPVALALELRRRPVDLLHVQYTAPPFCPAPVVATIHDLAFEHYPETFTRRGSWQLRLTVRYTARRAARLLTVSEFSREDLLRTYGLPAGKVVVTHNGVEPQFNPGPKSADEAERVAHRYGLREGYLLALGSLQPRKNLARLIKAYAALRRTRPDLTPPLVIAGRELWLTGDIYREIDRELAGEPWRRDIVFTGYVPETDLPALYRGARMLVYPSLFEGFGLPPVEAMACGTPVITSRTGSLPEVCGEAASYVDPLRVESITAAMLELLDDESLRRRLIGLGLEQARRFDWQETAVRTRAVYDSILAGGAPVTPSASDIS